MKRVLQSLFLAAFVAASFIALVPQSASALTYQNNRIIDDVVFDNTGSMTAASIDNFLNTFPDSCISSNSGFRAIDPTGYNPTDGYIYGGYVTAGQVIYDSAQAYGLNPQVILATLQKEQSLVVGGASYCNDGNEHKYAAAVGYGCPDSGTSYSYTGLDLYQRNGVTISSTGTTCVNSANKAGFSQQVIRAAWLFKFGEERSKGNIGWAVIKGDWVNTDDPQSCYGGPMTTGTWQRCPSGSTAYYDGYTTIDGTAVHMDSGATAALYWYTPHFHGNQNFFDLFVSWFGSPYSGTCISSLTNGATDVIFNNRKGKQTAIGNFMIYSGAATNCVEFHGWNPNLNTWAGHNASNSSSINPDDSEIRFADIYGTGTKVPVLIGLKNTGSGKVEFHIWNSDLQTWSQHIISNAPCIDTAVSKIEFADLNGDGKDEGVLIGEGNGSTSTDNIEFHVWSQNFQSFSSNIVSNSHTLDPAVSTVQFADFDGDGRDVGVLIGQGNGSTSTGNIEFHIWDTNFGSWSQHIVSNSHTIDPTVSKIMFANVNGDGRDYGVLVGLRPPTGSGNIEFHVWNGGLQSWNRHIASNQSAVVN